MANRFAMQNKGELRKRWHEKSMVRQCRQRHGIITIDALAAVRPRINAKPERRKPEMFE